MAAWGHPGGRSEQQEGHMGAHNYFLINLGRFFGFQFESFLSLNGSNSVCFVQACFLATFRIDSLIEILAGIATNMFPQFSLLLLENNFLVFFGGLGDSFFDLCCLADRHEN